MFLNSRFSNRFLALAACFSAPCAFCAASGAGWKTLAEPEVRDGWVRPAQGKAARPVWGHAEGLRVGLWPMPGPRGLLRIYTPYLGHAESRAINFIAIEPMPEGERRRGFSELEMSDLDNARGKRIWSADHPRAWAPRPADRPARGLTDSSGATPTLTVFVFVEPFHNGARVRQRLRFRADRPYEVGIATFAHKESKALKHCVVTATMGNWARLRHVYLNDGVKSSLDLWPGYSGNGFTPHAKFSLEDLIRTGDGGALFVAAPNEKHPEGAAYAPGTPGGWRYYGKRATQYWRCEKPHPQLQGWVNGRFTYWASQSPIPGGVAYENFELMEPFRTGVEYWFGVTPLSPETFINAEK